MKIGDPNHFALESEILVRYPRLSQRALGYFVIYVSGRRYGVMKPDATLLACSLDSVIERIAMEGMHTNHFADRLTALQVAELYFQNIYGENKPQIGGVPDDWPEQIAKHRIVWAPDGDQAFDDGSFVLQFDVGDRVRIVAFTTNEQGIDCLTVAEEWLSNSVFYRTLIEWRDAFFNDLSQMPGK